MWAELKALMMTQGWDVAATEQLMLNAQQCVRILGEKPAARLLGAHGARRLEAEQVQVLEA